MISLQIVGPTASIDARDQGRRHTCLAFALCTLCHGHSPDPAGLSPEYLYHHAAALMPGWVTDSGLSIEAGFAVSSKVASEVDCPYQPNDPPTPLPPPPSGLACFGAQAVERSRDIAQLISELQQGASIGLVLMLTDLFYAPTGDRILDGGSVVPDSHHAVVAIGLGWEDGEPFFLIRNSWGTGWADAGNAWISSSYIQQHATFAFGV